jgi:hypothetical protein
MSLYFQHNRARRRISRHATPVPESALSWFNGLAVAGIRKIGHSDHRAAIPLTSIFGGVHGRSYLQTEGGHAWNLNHVQPLGVISCYNKSVCLTQIIITFLTHSSVTVENLTDVDTKFFIPNKIGNIESWNALYFEKNLSHKHQTMVNCAHIFTNVVEISRKKQQGKTERSDERKHGERKSRTVGTSRGPLRLLLQKQRYSFSRTKVWKYNVMHFRPQH